MKWIKSILKWLLAIVVLLFFIRLGMISYIRSEIKQLSGENTSVVDASQFKYIYGKLAITNVNILTPEADSILYNQTVLINNNIIEYVGGSEEVPHGYEVIEASGKYVIPGLIDTHIHPYQSKNDLLLYLANGITHVAIMNSWKGLYLKWRKEAEEGALSPQIYVAAGPMNTARDFKSKAYGRQGPIPVFNDPLETRKAVKEFNEKGYNALKAYSLDSINYYAVAEVAKEQGIAMVGHLTPAVTLNDLYESGQSQVAHVEEITKAVEREFGGRSKIYYDNTEAYLTFLKENADSIAINIRNNNITVSTTINVYPRAKDQDLNLIEYLKSIELEYLNPGILEGSIFNPGWLPGSNKYENPSNTDEKGVKNAEIFWNTYIEAVDIMTLALVRNGVRITAGTDAGNPGIVPGFSLHDELEHLSNIGLSNHQVLYSATVAASEWLDSNAGKIQIGRKADLVLLDKNPLDDIRNTRSINGIISNGKYLDRMQLDKMLKSVKDANNQSREINIDEYLKG